MAHLVGLVDLEIILRPGKPLGPDFLFLLIHFLPVWRPLSGRKTSSFLKLHGDLLLPKVSFRCSAPITVGPFPSWNRFLSVPPFLLVPSVRPAFFRRRVCTPLLHSVLIGRPRHFSRKMKYEPALGRPPRTCKTRGAAYSVFLLPGLAVLMGGIFSSQL